MSDKISRKRASLHREQVGENNKKQASAKVLLQLYTVVMGASFSIAAKSCFESVDIAKLPLFLSFVVTFIPFFHGCAAIFQDAHIDSINERVNMKSLCLDTSLMILHGMAFASLAGTITSTYNYCIIVFILLTLDIIWCLAVFHISSVERQIKAAQKWGWINFITILVSVPLFINYEIEIQNNATSFFPLWALFLSLLRSVADYSVAWGEYFTD